MSSIRRQGRYWILTIPVDDWQPWVSLPDLLSYVHGQQELGSNSEEGGEPYHHWQVFVIASRKVSLAQIKSCFSNTTHAELTRSEAAEEYCLKDATCIEGTRFELGVRPIRRNERVDWERVWESAKSGDIIAIPPDIRIRHYRTLQQIAADFATPPAIEREVFVYWGRSGTGKSQRAWMEAGSDAYSKDPRTKFWYGYRGERNVIFDEFRGDIDIAHVLRWIDRYPVSVEFKGSSTSLVMNKVWFTSNLSPDEWYPNADAATLVALRRRFTNVVHFQ